MQLRQIPSYLCFYDSLTFNYSVSEMQTFTELHNISGTLEYQGSKNIAFDIMSGLLMDQNYTLSVTVSTDSGDSSITTSVMFGEFDNTIIKLSYLATLYLILDTIFQPRLPGPLPCYSNNKIDAADTFVYKMAIGICVGVAIVILIFLVLVLIYIQYRERKRQSKMDNNKN